MCFMKTALTCLAMLAFLGCSGDPKSNSPTSAPAFDPVADYTKFIDSEIKRVENIKCSFHEGKIDVQKTDSLVSPLVGSYNCKVWLQMDLELGTVVAFYEVEMSHGRQGEKWVMTTGKAKQVGWNVLKGDKDILDLTLSKSNGKVLKFSAFDDLNLK